MIRVLLVDDQALIRAGLRTILQSDSGIEVVGEAADGFAALALLERTEVDVVLMDIRMPGIDGVETTRRLRGAADRERVRVLVLTTFEEDGVVLGAMRAGADGFVGKGAGPAELIDAVKRISAGEHALSPKALGAIVEQAVAPRDAPPDPAAVQRLADLTQREREVVAAIVEGLDNAEIAARLFVSPLTVKTHANRAMAKADVRDRAQLVSLAVRAGVRPA